MGHKMLSASEQFLGYEFENTFLINGKTINDQSEDDSKEFDYFFSALSNKELKTIYGRVYTLFCNPYTATRILNDTSDYEILINLNGKTLPEISRPEMLKEVFLAMLQAYKQQLLRNAEEAKALSLMPKEIMNLWGNPDFWINAYLICIEAGVVKILSGKDWGELELSLTDAECLPPLMNHLAYDIDNCELYCTKNGFGLSFRCHMNNETAETEMEVQFNSIECHYHLFNYYQFSIVHIFPVQRTNLIQVSHLSRLLGEKYCALGDTGLNETEKWLYPASEVLQHLYEDYNIKTVRTWVEMIKALPEQLEKWSELFRADGKDKYLCRLFSSIARCKRNMNAKNIREAFHRIKNTDLELTTNEGRFALHWILSLFKKACGEYYLNPPIGVFHKSVSDEFHSFVTSRLSDDGFSGIYPHFRRITPSGTAQFISFSEISYVDPNGLSVMMTVGTATPDVNNCIQGIPYETFTAYECQHPSAKNKVRYSIICGIENPAYEVNCLPVGNDNAKSPEAAKVNFEIHLRQAYRVLSGLKMEKSYKRQYGIKSNLMQAARKLAIFCLVFGAGWATAFWLLFSVSISISEKQPYLDVLLDSSMIYLYFASGLIFAFVLWLVFFVPAIRMHDRK